MFLTYALPLYGQETLASKIDLLCQPALEEQHIVGMSVGVLVGDRRIVRGYGKQDDSGAAPPDGKTIYEIGSITKVFTALLLADFVVRDELQLEQPVRDLLPASVAEPSLLTSAVTLQQLATHVSGLPRMPNNFAPTDIRNPFQPYDEQRLYTYLRELSVAPQPMKKYVYSNLGAGLLGHLLARHAQTDYADLVHRRISQPLGLPDTTIDLTESQRRRLATPYLGPGTEATNWDFQALAGAGALRSTVDDLLTFAAAVVAPPDNSLGKAIELTWRVHQEPLDEADIPLGLGWHLDRSRDTRWHNGQTGGYHSMLFIRRHPDLAVVVLANTATPHVDRVTERVWEMVKKHDFTADEATAIGAK